ncbi:MAG: lytic transglycosylase domain-containing protein [Alphaproteobacteria bacterium]|nr:lytic transglycosylase domain-containing protein [Alphaproteobacteria bacterium]
MARLRYLCAAVLLAAGLISAPPLARATPVPEAEDWSACLAATDAVERARRLPAHLLTAISLVESGRWHSAQRQSHAWPWTVTHGGKTGRFERKADAISEVRRLQKGGVRNIDVGCMQVNLHYHPEAFADLETAFDPMANVRYAADFLAALRDTHGSWQKAVGHYHSATPARNRSYRNKVRTARRSFRQEQMRAKRKANRMASLEATPERGTEMPAEWRARPEPEVGLAPTGAAAPARPAPLVEGASAQRLATIGPSGGGSPAMLTSRAQSNARFPPKRTIVAAQPDPLRTRRGRGLADYRSDLVQPPTRLTAPSRRNFLGLRPTF